MNLKKNNAITPSIIAIVCLFFLFYCSTPTKKVKIAPVISLIHSLAQNTRIQSNPSEIKPHSIANKKKSNPKTHTTLILNNRKTQTATFTRETENSMNLEGVSIQVPAGAMPKTQDLLIVELMPEDLPPIPAEMINVTKNSAGYRFLPHSMRFDTAVTISMAYDVSLLPVGFTSNDIYTFYYNENDHKWEALDRVQIDEVRQSVVSRTLHFTDMINAIIRAPESPETQGYVPTSIKNLKIASPAAEISQIALPKANSKGDAEITFPFELPDGRVGMKPQFEMKYNSSGSSSWTGYGWDLSLPSVSVDAMWGVPRYLKDKESETYLLNGCQLTPLAHRSEFIKRTGEKHFHPRIESDFSEIIRHGNSPKEYWWEVISKNGTRSYYGGKNGIGKIQNAISTDKNGNIGYWALTEIRDIHGNFISYNYFKPSGCGQKLYPAEILYTGYDTLQGPYKIEFLLKDQNNTFERKDISIDARMGFAQRDSFLLKRINITCNNKPIRSYSFNYTEGAFYKSLLNNITAFNAAGDIFYTHKFGYYDDIQYEKGYKPYSETKIFHPITDNLKKNFINPISDSLINSSAIGSSKSSGFSAGGALTIGYDANVASKELSLGGNGTYIYSKADGILTLIDINGDGLPDKVFKEGNNVYYRRNLGTDSINLFSERKLINGIHEISNSTTTGFTAGPEFNLSLLYLGYNYTRLTTTTPAYFSDFNADGLIDFRNNEGKILYNHINSEGNPEFTEISDDTPNAVHGAKSSLDKSLIQDPQIEQDILAAQFPLLDAVRMWKAPYNGSILIKAPVNLIRNTSPVAISDKYKDGVKVSIQRAKNIIWNTELDTTHYNVTPYETIITNISKGECFYFRVQSIFNGSYDQVKWDPEITYLNINGNDSLPKLKDVNNKIIGRFRASEDFTLNGKQVFNMPESGFIHINSLFTKPITSDTLRLEIFKTDTSKNSTLIDSFVFGSSDSVTNYIIKRENIHILEDESFQFRVVASTNIDWSKIKWNINLSYSQMDDTAANRLFLNNPVYKFKIIPEFTRMFNNTISNEFPPYVVVDTTFYHQLIYSDSIDNEHHSINITPQNITASVQDSFILSVKTKNKILGENIYAFFDSTYYIHPLGQINDSIPIHKILPKNRMPFKVNIRFGDSLYFEYDYFNYKETEPSHPLYLSYKDTIIKINLYKGKSPVTKIDTLFTKYDSIPVNNNAMVNNASYYSPNNPDDVVFGPMYRGWGQFAYKEDPSKNIPYIDPLLLKINADASSKDKFTSTKDSSGTAGQINPMDEVFNIMVPCAGENYYLGADSQVYVTPDIMSSSRRGQKNIKVETKAYSPSGQTAKEKKTLDTSHSGTGGITGYTTVGLFTLAGNLLLSHTWSNSNITDDMMDMNGDRYPDWLTSDAIQLTGALGGLNDTTIKNPMGNHISKATALGGSTGGNCVIAGHYNSKNQTPGGCSKSTVNNSAKASENASLNAQKSKTIMGVSPGITGNIAWSEDYTAQTLLDMNSDGLPDLVKNNGDVSLNLGYSFDSTKNWHFDAIRVGDAYDFAAGFGLAGVLGKNKANGSLMVGTSVSKSNYEAHFALMDINGDGLPDLIKGYTEINTDLGFPIPIDRCIVYINTGSELKGPIAWDTYFHNFDKGQAAGESINGAFTIGVSFLIPIISIPIKICVNPSASGNSGFCKLTTQFTDINGDGVPDYLESASENNLNIKLSTLGRTNLLKTVQLPMGSNFTIGYKESPANYEHPGGKWVLESVKSFDGLPGDGADTSLLTFDYSNGFYNRRERQFYGFETVRTNYHFTGDNHQIYRSVEQKFDNRYYYTKGLLRKETIFDGKGQMQKGSENFYSLHDIKTGIKLVNAYGNNDTLPLFVALGESRQYSFGPNNTLLITTMDSLRYDTLGNISKYTDYCTGNASDRVEVNIKYHRNDAKHIYSVPSLQEVYTEDGLMRKNKTLINDKGDITSVIRMITSKDSAIYDMDYDKYGNLKKIKRPENINKDRLSYTYDYDSVLHSLVTRVIDAYGDTSSTVYHPLFALPIEKTDINGEKIKYTYDAYGRLDTVIGPYELASKKPYSVVFGYHPEAKVPYALTKHFDDANAPDIEVYSFTDGLGRQVQLKKTALNYTGENTDDTKGFVISGKVMYDAFGRTSKVYQQIFESASDPVTYDTTVNKIAPTIIHYDVLNRPMQVILPDNSKTNYSYTIGNYNGNDTYIDSIADANGNITVKYISADGNMVATKAINEPEEIITRYDYDALDELKTITDPMGKTTQLEYDKLGRRISVNQPDAGLTEYVYDAAGNLNKTITANLRLYIPTDGAIIYKYDHERLTEILYPKNTQNRVNYSYGKPGEKFGRVGRLKLIQDASGGQEFYYGRLGETIKTIRTVQLSNSDMRTWIWSANYDTWNRIQSMTYPDGEKVNYQYNIAGNLLSVKGEKLGRNYDYIKRIGYDKDEQQVYLKYGNNSVTTYNYEPLRKRLHNINVISDNVKLMDNIYNYDNLNNILKITNHVDSVRSFGGNLTHSYSYDKIYRLTDASGYFIGNKDTCNYQLSLLYDNSGNILNKKQTHTKNKKEQAATSYNFQYKYENNKPNAASSIGDRIFIYDANGNLSGWQDTASNNFRQLAWDEENRLTYISDNGYVNRYVYDASGERIIKSHGGSQGVYINGAPAGIVNHTDKNYTVYVSPYFVLQNDQFTKHYYTGNTRFVSKIGNGQFENQYRPGVFEITAGGINYINRQQQINAKKKETYKGLIIPPGPPTLKGIYGEPEYTYKALTDTTPIASVPVGWPHKPVYAPAGGPPGAPVQWGDSITNDNATAGFGYTGTGNVKEDLQYFFHTDHIGSTNYITDATGNVKQYIAYMPFGETLIEQNSNWSTTNKFNAKELDTETGLYFYGAKYYDPKISRWLSSNPSYIQYPSVSPFAYCANNPVIYNDINNGKPILANIDAQRQLLFMNMNGFTNEKLTFTDSTFATDVDLMDFSENYNNIGNDNYSIEGSEDNTIEGKAGDECDEKENKKSKEGKDPNPKKENTGGVKNDTKSKNSGTTKPVEKELNHELIQGQKTKNQKQSFRRIVKTDPLARMNITRNEKFDNFIKELKQNPKFLKLQSQSRSD